MKLHIYGILILIATVNPIEANKCSDRGLQVLEKCYAKLFLNQLDFSFPYLAPNFIQELKQEISTSDGVIKRCEQEKVFRDCLKNYADEDVITNCVNIESYLGLSFTRNVTKWAKQYVASFIEIDYICGDGYNSIVYFNDCINSIHSICKNEDLSGCQKDYIKCMKETTEQECGAAAGCFAHKDSTINVCYHETNCSYCEDLDFNNNNFYANLCHDDASFIPPSTTTTPTTTTDNSTINIIVVTRPERHLI
uniref:Uncharacterized protein n=1 Tax=Panagrolaimus sp. ES5 TaxID=591445 RepID=A0AC34GYD9_9BILA